LRPVNLAPGCGGTWLLGRSSAGAITGADERLGPDHIRILPAGREDSMPPVLAPDPQPAETDLLHRVSSP
jgi:hypothetical protein